MIFMLVRRLGAGVLTLLAVCLLTYLIFFKLSPDPALQICGQTCTPERIDQIRDQLGLNEPFWTQFVGFLGGLVGGRTYGTGVNTIACGAPCLGYSFQNGVNVTDMVIERLPVTLTVAAGAAVLWVVTGVLAGMVSALLRGSVLDRIAMGYALTGVALPNYFVALLLQYVLVVKLEILPFPSAVPFAEDPLLWFQSYLMPWMVLALMYSAMYARLTRANMIDTMSEDFMRTARAKGLPWGTMMRRHALRPSLTPLVTVFGMDLATLLGGALITETVFGLNGIGKMAYDAISTNDQPVIMAVTLLASFFVVVANVGVDLTYSMIDPRVRGRLA